MEDTIYVCQDFMTGEFYKLKDLDYCEQRGDIGVYAGTKEEILKEIEMDIEDLQKQYVRIEALLDE